MFDVITLGSATKDIFIKAIAFRKEKNLVFPLGEKLELEEIKTLSGGGGVNAATTFVRQGFKTAFCGVVGQDLAGQEILDELHEKDIATELVRIKQRCKTDLGLVFHAESERTILLFHGASQSLKEKDLDPEKLRETHWIYFAPLWGQAAKLTPFVLNRVKHKVKIAINPSLDQLKLKNIWEILKSADVLLLNDEETSFLTGVKPYQETKVFHYLCSKYDFEQGERRIMVITKGKDGATAFDGKFLYQIPAPAVEVVDATGAGDSFGAGFVVGLRQKKSIPDSLRLAMANAISNIQVFGANKGLLKIGDPIPVIKVSQQSWSN